MEIDQRWVVQHAADRQQHIDQAQSLNVFFRPDSHIKYIHAVHFQAWKSGLKTMYYCRSDKIAKADKVSKRIEQEIIKEIEVLYKLKQFSKLSSQALTSLKYAYNVLLLEYFQNELGKKSKNDKSDKNDKSGVGKVIDITED
jgi:ribonucleotide reductase alpha subunit